MPGQGVNMGLQGTVPPVQEKKRHKGKGEGGGTGLGNKVRQPVGGGRVGKGKGTMGLEGTGTENGKMQVGQQANQTGNGAMPIHSPKARGHNGAGQCKNAPTNKPTGGGGKFRAMFSMVGTGEQVVGGGQVGVCGNNSHNTR